MPFNHAVKLACRVAVLCALPLVTTACMSSQNAVTGQPAEVSRGRIDPERGALALVEYKQRRARGERVWCVPYARTASGVEIRGNAGTWWGQAKGVYQRGHQPQVGAVMAFAASQRIPKGHVAVVSEVVSPREIRVDHANWKRSRLSMGMSVIDVSDGNDWSRVKLESQPDTYGSVYPINGFIYPETVEADASRG